MICLGLPPNTLLFTFCFFCCCSASTASTASSSTASSPPPPCQRHSNSLTNSRCSKQAFGSHKLQSSGSMQRADVDLRAIASSGKDAARKMEEAMERLLRQAATGADNSKQFDFISSCCDANKYTFAIRSCAFSLVPSCSGYEENSWGALVQAVVAEVHPSESTPPSSSHAMSPQINADCSGASASERTAASAIRDLASVPCAWLQPHALDLCDALRAAASMCPPQLIHLHMTLTYSRQCSCLLCLVTTLTACSLQPRQRLRLLPLHHIGAMRCVRMHW